MEVTLKQIFDRYDNFKNQNIDSNRITHALVKQEIKTLANKGVFSVNVAGQSINGLDIFSITIGRGQTKILAWSQMHGDEPTATAAIFDLLNFFSTSSNFEKFKNDLLNKIQITFVPMLNPDGAELHNRANSINVDINRDAVKKESYESNILWKLAGEIKPEFGFNLHDQNSYYTAGRVNKTAAISLLAPPTDYEKSINEARKKSMQVISVINKQLTEIIPGHIARYDDEFEPRAFGDNLTKFGISSILIESGYIKDDEDKSYIRKLNFISLLTAFKSISDQTYISESEEDYFKIPENESLLFDLLLRNLTYKYNGKEFNIDIGINREKKYDPINNFFYYKGTIKEVGDLSNYFGIDEYNLEALHVEPVKIYENTVSTKSELDNMDYTQLHKNGYGIIRIDKELLGINYLQYPVSAIPNYKNYNMLIAADEFANLFIKKNDVIVYIVVNGFIIPIKGNKNRILNGLAIS